MGVPLATEQERAIASVAINHPLDFLDAFSEARFILGDIFDPLAQSTVRAVLENAGRGESCEIIVLFGKIKETMPDLQFFQLSELYTVCPVVSALPDLFNRVRDTAKRRQLQVVLGEAYKATNSGVSAKEIVSTLDSKVSAISTELTPPNRMDKKALLMDASNRYETGEDESRIIKTGFRDIDNITPIYDGDLLVIGGQEKSGKTTLALNFIANIIIRDYEANHQPN